MNISNTFRVEIDKYIRSASASIKINDDVYGEIIDHLDLIEKEDVFSDDPVCGDGFAVFVAEDTNSVVLSFASPEIDFSAESAMVDLIGRLISSGFRLMMGLWFCHLYLAA